MTGAATALAVALAGGLGAACRYLADSWIRDRWESAVPWATLAINTSASLLLGLLAGLAASRSLSGTVLSVAGTGFCGGYSTFSTAAVELVRLIEVRERRAAAAYAGAMLLLPVLAAAAGFHLTTI